MKKDKLLFNILNKKTKQKFKRFQRFYINDSKKFINKISRDYEKSGKFPVHVLKSIKKIKKKDYDSAVCILRGALPYAILFEVYGWKVHYVICGRKNEKITIHKEKLRFNKNVDATIGQIVNKRILIIENNIFSGNSPIRVALELRKAYNIKKPDLFLDYLCKNNVFGKDKRRIKMFRKIFIASKIKIDKKERNKLMKEFLERLR